MPFQKSIAIEKQFSFAAKLQDYGQLTKMRLSGLVVFSAAMGFVIATRGDFSWTQLLILVTGGYMVTGASNAFNQVIEKDLDRQMSRTALRPLPDGRMSTTEAIISASLMSVAGISMLWLLMNPLCGMLSALSLLLYTTAYTPSKRYTSFSVLIGAIPGAFPPMLGWIAAKNEIGLEAVMLYVIQFIWQFPHFWAIAWNLDDDYRKVGFKMLPTAGGRTKSTAFITMVYTSSLVPLALLIYHFNITGITGMCIIAVCGMMFTYQSYRLFESCSIKAAQRLMFGSFFYLPVVQIVIMLDKIF
ncbi:MAG: heme o synthase [Bacteroidetes bacterium]|nr:heme o synthase [Bacteroidota bacterium]